MGGCTILGCKSRTERKQDKNVTFHSWTSQTSVKENIVRKPGLVTNMGGQYRRVWWNVVTNFVNSLRPRQMIGNKMGKDYIGNAYFEIPANPSAGKRKPSRWYTPPKDQDFQDPIPAEWEAWLRMRRAVPPTEEEIAKNLAIAQMKKINAAKIETKRLSEGGSLPTIPEKGAQSFPVYPDLKPGDPEDTLGNK